MNEKKKWSLEVNFYEVVAICFIKHSKNAIAQQKKGETLVWSNAKIIRAVCRLQAKHKKSRYMYVSLQHSDDQCTYYSLAYIMLTFIGRLEVYHIKWREKSNYVHFIRDIKHYKHGFPVTLRCCVSPRSATSFSMKALQTVLTLIDNGVFDNRDFRPCANPQGRGGRVHEAFENIVSAS